MTTCANNDIVITIGYSVHVQQMTRSRSTAECCVKACVKSSKYSRERMHIQQPEHEYRQRTRRELFEEEHTVFVVAS